MPKICAVDRPSLGRPVGQLIAAEAAFRTAKSALGLRPILRRYLRHVLPRGLWAIRYYGCSAADVPEVPKGW